MDAPWIAALVVFLGIFLMSVIISLLSDLLIIGTAAGCAAAAYFLPNWYPLFFDAVQNTQLPVYLGLAAPIDGALEPATRYIMTILLIIAGTLICIPALPFSAIYRQILGADKIGKRDEIFVRALVRSELDSLTKSARGQEKAVKAQAVVKSRRPPPPPDVVEPHTEFEPQIESADAHASAAPSATKESNTHV